MGLFASSSKRLAWTQSFLTNGSTPLCAGRDRSSASAPEKEGRMKDQVSAEHQARVAAVRQRVAKLLGDIPATQAAPEKL